MARTKGSNSIASINWRALVRHMEGKEIASQCRYEGFVDVSRVWVQNYFTPTSELVLVDRSDIESPFAAVNPNANEIVMQPREQKIPITANCVPREFELTPEDLGD